MAKRITVTLDTDIWRKMHLWRFTQNPTPIIQQVVDAAVTEYVDRRTEKSQKKGK